MRAVELPKLHEAQKPIAESFLTHRRVVMRCGRRFGKTTLLERTAAKRAMLGQRVGWFGPQYRLNTPTYSRILRMASPRVERKSKIDQIIEMKGSGCVEFWTLNDPDAGRSRFYDLVIIDEASLVPKGLKDTWEQAIAPTLLDRGGSAIMAGTPKGIDPENFFYAACSDRKLGWLEVHRKTEANPTLSPDEVAKLIDEYPPLVYQQEYLAEFVDWRGTAFFSEESLLLDGQPVDYPNKADFVFAVIDTAAKDGAKHDGTAVIWCSYNRLRPQPLTILDWDVVQIQGAMLEDWLPSVAQRCEDFAQECNARMGSAGIWIEDASAGIVLIRQAERRGIKAHAIESKLTSLGKEPRALSVSGYVYRGLVKISRHAYEKTTNFKGQTRNHLLAQVCQFRVGEKQPHDDLLDTFTYAVALTLGDSLGY